MCTPGCASRPTTLHPHLAAAKGAQFLSLEKIGDLGYKASLQVKRVVPPIAGHVPPPYLSEDGDESGDA